MANTAAATAPAPATPSPAVAETAPVAPSGRISIGLSEEERNRLLSAARLDLESAQTGLTSFGDGGSGGVADLVQTIKDLMKAAQAAEGRDDLQAAAALAHKARLLAANLRSH